MKKILICNKCEKVLACENVLSEGSAYVCDGNDLACPTGGRCDVKNNPWKYDQYESVICDCVCTECC